MLCSTLNCIVIYVAGTSKVIARAALQLEPPAWLILHEHISYKLRQYTRSPILFSSGEEICQLDCMIWQALLLLLQLSL